MLGLWPIGIWHIRYLAYRYLAYRYLAPQPYKPPGTLFPATLYFKNTLYSVARGFAVVNDAAWLGPHDHDLPKTKQRENQGNTS